MLNIPFELSHAEKSRRSLPIQNLWVSQLYAAIHVVIIVNDRFVRVAFAALLQPVVR